MSQYARVEELLIVVVGGGLSAVVAHLAGWWALVPAFLAAALLAFYRDPQRQSPTAGDLVLAPADGRVVEIARHVPGPDGTGRLRIMIFLSVFDVHVNRSPCAGRVAEVQYRPGQFVNALSAAADTRNECNTITLEPAPPLPGPISVRQIAGILARRIVCAVQPGDRLTAGQRFGMIKLGSRTEVCLPESPDWEVLVEAGRQVYAGLTPLLRLRTTKVT